MSQIAKDSLAMSISAEHFLLPYTSFVKNQSSQAPRTF
jgi:hypothetical protein